jgi:hypothetical protein
MRAIKNLEFAVEDHSGRKRIFKTFDVACGFAVSLAASDGRAHNVDVLIYSEAAARAWGGGEGLEQYREDPDASVSDRIEITANHVGRVA